MARRSVFLFWPIPSISEFCHGLNQPILGQSFRPWATCPARAEISKKSVPWAEIRNNVAGCEIISQNHIVNREISSKKLIASNAAIPNQSKTYQINSLTFGQSKCLINDLSDSLTDQELPPATMQFYSLRCSDEEVQIRQKQLLEYTSWTHLFVWRSEKLSQKTWFSSLLLTFVAIPMKLHLQRMCQGARSEPPWVTTSSLLQIDVNSDVSSAHLLTNLEVVATRWQCAQIPHKTIFNITRATSLCSSEGLQSLPYWLHAFSERQGRFLWLCSCKFLWIFGTPSISIFNKQLMQVTSDASWELECHKPVPQDFHWRTRRLWGLRGQNCLSIREKYGGYYKGSGDDVLLLYLQECCCKKASLY